MPRSKKLIRLLHDLVELVEEQAAKNPEFDSKLDALLEPVLGGRRSVPAPRRRGEQLAIPDVFTAYEEKGVEEFRFWLRDFDAPILRQIIKTNGFDVARVAQKWKDPDKLLDLIAEQTAARLRRGSGFLRSRSK